MKKKFYNILALSLALQTFVAPTHSFAESIEKTAELSTDEQALKNIEEHAKQHRHDEENDLEISGEYLLHLSTKLPLYDSNDLKTKTNIEIAEPVVKATKKKGNAYYIQTTFGAGWINKESNSLEVQEIHKLSNQKLIVTEEASVYSFPFQSFKEETKLQPQTVTPTEQAGNWFNIQMNGTEKWIYAPSATFDGTKASLFEKTGAIEKRSATFFKTPSNLPTNNVYGVTFKEMIVPKGNENIRPGYAMEPKYITIHETANTSKGANALNHAKYLDNQARGNTDRSASWHFTVDDKEIYQHLPLNEVGWHAGDKTGNYESIGIEIAVNSDGNYTKAVENARKLAAFLMNELNISLDHVQKHQFWSGKNCPAFMIQRGQWDAFLKGTNAYYNEHRKDVMPPPEVPHEKDDIAGGWYEQDIRQLAARKIMFGDGNGSYWPNRLVTRAEFANLMSRALKLPAGNAKFTDLNEAHPSLIDGINRAASAGIINGRGNNKFDPNATITRDEAVIMIDRALEYNWIYRKEVKLPFTDQHLAYDKKALQNVYAYGIVKGNERNEFVPKGTATRAEAAAFLNRMLKVIEA
ncbi:S-layer homology domain-containing protein [Bacillus paranthracis]|uniref:S-layer homology domain-containing protein n=1 Tax=Bacillus cereus group TaxID=86661 RepID=UPI0022E71445|nr:MULTISPECIES: S-layer homology domain-containing protein [Bacillus cereus group]MBL3847051.1 S-layer homology domain-containing protein [Bacillus cereus]MDA1893805.1 S-layer homology domain-containing protein [Bacillus cereus group sp. BY11-1LC]MDA2591478.1 S-layer homology domain-containing protein [Bacillus cereus group sp. Bc065]MDK7442473.1 S-layer homology domain-containing protein [Bacillus paranthracis]MDK7459367.1 S-layer homology domain-containing protein [Bacillus paranthracis]